MTACAGYTRPVLMLLCRVWHIPDGFATFLGAVATMFAGSLAIIGAVVAWRSVQRQIASAETMERERRNAEARAIEVGFLAEMLVYSAPLIAFLSQANFLARDAPGSLWKDQNNFDPPLFYLANVSQVGRITNEHAVLATVTFYSHLQHLRSLMGGANVSGVVQVTHLDIATTLRIMAMNMARTIRLLDGDEPPRMIEHQWRGRTLHVPDGTILDWKAHDPGTIDRLLDLLAGALRVFPPQSDASAPTLPKAR